MSFEPFDRLPLLEWAGWWNKTIDRWHGAGLPTDLTDRWRCHYNTVRPHSSLGYRPPAPEAIRINGIGIRTDQRRRP